MVQMTGDAAQITGAVTVGVEETTWVDLVDDGRTPPRLGIGARGAGTSSWLGGGADLAGTRRGRGGHVTPHGFGGGCCELVGGAVQSDRYAAVGPARRQPRAPLAFWQCRARSAMSARSSRTRNTVLFNSVSRIQEYNPSSQVRSASVAGKRKVSAFCTWA